MTLLEMTMKCFKNRKKKTKKHKYKVWKELYHVLLVFMLAMMVLFAIQITMLSSLLVE